MSVTADKDSLEYSARGRISEFPNFKKKINQKDWENLISGIDLKAIEQTKSGERRGLYDGSDEIFRIETSGKEYEIVNASDSSENYKQLEKLKINLNNLVSKYK